MSANYKEWELDNKGLVDTQRKAMGCHSCLPCCWVVGPILWYSCLGSTYKHNMESRKLATDGDLILFEMGPTYNCCKIGLCMQGKQKQSIPMSRVQEVKVKEPNAYYPGTCASYDFKIVEIETAANKIITVGSGNDRRTISVPELTVHGLVEADAFRDLVMSNVKGGGNVVAAQPSAGGGGGGSASASERIAEAQKLLDQGIMTQAEFEAKKKEIISSL